ncbi:MAG: DUF1272 domain-containing protein [Acidobacteriota bacterium]|nr:DUF1272 domain-containing protein [Acidobacteriota bacterium]
MLQMRPNCQACDAGLPPGSSKARICSFERTFCASCADKHLGGKCPGCGGELVARPRRAVKYLLKYPASTKRVYKPMERGKAAKAVKA